MVLLRAALATLVLLVACGSAAAQQVTVERDSALHAEPRPDAPVLAKLTKGTPGEAIGRQAAWLNLKTPTATGWVLSFNVRFSAPEGSASGGGAASGAARLFGAHRPQITATIGTRGLEAEDLKRASFDAQQLQLLDGYAVSKDDAADAAHAAGLAPVKLDYLVK